MTDPPLHYDDLFPSGYTPFTNPNTHLCPNFGTLPCTPSFPLDPPPSYNFLFTTGVPLASAEASQISQTTGITLICGTQMLGWIGTCSSSSPVHPLITSFSLFSTTSAQTLIKKTYSLKWILDMADMDRQPFL